MTSLALSTRLVTNPDPTLEPGILHGHQPGARWRLERAGGRRPQRPGAIVGIVVVAVRRVEGTPVAVPGPIAGAGLPALLALGGFVLWARRRKFVRGPMISL